MSRDRIFSSTVMILLTISAVLNTWMFLLVIVLLTVGGLYEFFYLIKKKGIPIYSYTGIAIGGLIPVSIFFQFSPTKGWELLFIVLALLAVFFMQFLRNDNRDAIIGISTTLFGVLYVSWLFSYLIKTRFLLPGIDGVKLVAYILLITKSGDIGALFIGSKFGRTPLLKSVSPNKTIEGSFGSLLFSAIVAVFCSSLLPHQLQFSVMQYIGIGVFFGAIGQVGDMSESLIKRDCNVKDSGKLMPGLGGVLDMIDSLLFSAPVYYFFMSSVLT